MSRAELLERIRSELARLDDVLSRIPEQAMSAAGPEPGAWSAKDQLAHLSAWHRVALARVFGRPEGEMFGWPEGSFEKLDLDQLNARFHEQFRVRPLGDVRDEMAASADQLLDGVEAMDDGALERPWLPEHPDRGTYEQMIAANTFEHYEEHLPALRSLAEE
jgi:hypothetical protein